MHLGWIILSGSAFEETYTRPPALTAITLDCCLCPPQIGQCNPLPRSSVRMGAHLENTCLTNTVMYFFNFSIYVAYLR